MVVARAGFLDVGADQIALFGRIRCAGLQPAEYLHPLAIAITQAVPCPTIGIGASAQCDGQVLVTEDMLGMFERVPRFVKRYEDIAGVIDRTVARYAEEVRARVFPGEDQTYQPKA